MINNKLVVQNLSKSFKHGKDFLTVLSSISFNIKSHEFVTFLGPSGCGKSTLFHILSGIEKEDSGIIKIDNSSVQNRKGHFGYMFQDDLLLPWLTVLQNVSIGLKIQGINEIKAFKKSGRLLTEFGLSKFKGYYPSTLSGGMRQRIALLRTIAFNSSILLLDEPFGSLDALTRLVLQDYLLDLWQKIKLTILFITHDIREAIFLSDRIYIFSPLPGAIVKTFEVRLPRPRILKHLLYQEAVFLEKELSKILLKADYD